MNSPGTVLAPKARRPLTWPVRVFELLIEVGAGGEDSGCETLKLSPGAGHDDAAFPSVEKGGLLHHSPAVGSVG